MCFYVGELVVSLLIRSSTDTTWVTAVLDILTELVYFHFKVKHKLFTSPPTNVLNIYTSLSLICLLLFPYTLA